jgi:hypothetical protein
MIIAAYAVAAVAMAAGSLYLAWRSVDVRKFLAGAFFVSSGILGYLALAGVSVPLLGTGFVETPPVSGSGRSFTSCCSRSASTRDSSEEAAYNGAEAPCAAARRWTLHPSPWHLSVTSSDRTGPMAAPGS